MKSEIKIVAGIFMAVLFLAGVGFYIKNYSSNQMPVSPFSISSNIFSIFSPQKRADYIVYGYLPYWTIESTKYLQMDKLTDIAYFGLYIEKDGNFKQATLNDQGNTIPEPGYAIWKNDKKLDDLIAKAKKAGVRFALTVIAHEDETTNKFLDCRTCWDNLLNNIKTELNSKQITNVNLNFEYSEYTDDDKAQKFTKLVKYFNNELDKTYKDSFLVVSAFADSSIKSRISSRLNELGREADGIFIMAYDFHRPTSDNAGPVSPIGGMGKVSEYDLNTMLKDFLSQIAPNKLILGVPYYGYNWLVSNSEPYAARIEGNDENGFSQSQVYDKIMQDIKEVKANMLWDSIAQVPYYSYTSPETAQIRQVYFENAQSLGLKYGLVKQNNLAGIGIWALGYDGDRPELWDLIGKEFLK